MRSLLCGDAYSSLTGIDFYTSSAFLGPACVFEPSDSYQMADAVLTFQNFTSPFAVRGGGHMPIADAANINSTGVLLSTAGLSQVQVSDDKKTVNIGPGNHWVDVYKGLEPYGLTVVGGRLGVVGVPGLLLGGGVSYFGNEYGWGSANIASFTVCLLALGWEEGDADEIGRPGERNGCGCACRQRIFGSLLGSSRRWKLVRYRDEL